MTDILEIHDAPTPLHVELAFELGSAGYKFKEYLKTLPGIKNTGAWQHDKRRWRVPKNYLPWLAKVAAEDIEAGGFDLQVRDCRTQRTMFFPESEYLKQFQIMEVTRAMFNPRLIWAWATGLGKTVATCALLEFQAAGRVLIVCPYHMKLDWEDALDRWWPDHPYCAQIKYGRDRQLSKPKTQERDLAFSAPFQIVNYDLLHEVSKGSWDYIIFDEAHALMHPKSKQSQAALALTEANPHAGVLMLTATPSPTAPKDLYGLLHVLEPGCWGNLRMLKYLDEHGQERKKPDDYSFDFRYRYLLHTREPAYEGGPTVYHWFDELNPVHAEEFKSRFEQVCSRITEADVADELPAIRYHVLRVDTGKIPKSWDQATAYENCGHKKIEHVKSWWQDRQMAGVKHGIIFTWHRDLAETLAAVCGGVVIHGGLSVEKRKEAIDTASAADSSLLVCTMASVGTGVNFGHASEVLFAEMNPRPERMEQACGRVGGFRTEGRGARITFMVSNDSVDERYAWKIVERLSNMDDIYANSEAGMALRELVDSKSEAESLQDLEFDFSLADLEFAEGDFVDE